MKKWFENFSWQEIIYLFVFGCLLGYIIETGFHFIKYGEYINKQGLLYGPFKPIYGFGIVLITLLFKRFKDKSILFIFIISVMFGTLFEYFGACFQEIFLHTYTWTYSHYPYSFAGKIYLPYCILWGILGVIWFKLLYPKFLKIIKKIPPKINRLLVILLSAFMIINLILSTYATLRLSERNRNIQPRWVGDKVIDSVYTDEYMNRKFPKLRVINNNKK